MSYPQVWCELFVCIVELRGSFFYLETNGHTSPFLLSFPSCSLFCLPKFSLCALFSGQGFPISVLCIFLTYPALCVHVPFR